MGYFIVLWSLVLLILKYECSETYSSAFFNDFLCLIPYMGIFVPFFVLAYAFSSLIHSENIKTKNSAFLFP